MAETRIRADEEQESSDTRIAGCARLYGNCVRPLSSRYWARIGKTIKPDGSATEETAKVARVSGGPGFLGKWRSTEVKSAPTNVKITTEGQNGITIEFPSSQAVSEGKFDGKDYVSTIAGAPSKQTVVFEKLAPNAFKMTTKLDGKPIYVDVFTVSDDGKTLTDDGNPSSAHEPMKAVYEKQ